MSKTGEPMTMNGTLTGNIFHGNYPRFYVSAGKRFQIAGLNSSEPVQVWNTTKPRCVNWNMVAGLSAIAVVSVAGWTGIALLISHLLG
jgi:hypothetical protein